MCVCVCVRAYTCVSVYIEGWGEWDVDGREKGGYSLSNLSTRTAEVVITAGARRVVAVRSSGTVGGARCSNT